MTTTEDSPADSVRAFAALCAALDHPFADRPALLGARRLDEAGFARLQERWAERFIADVDGLGARFAEAYAAVRTGGDSLSATFVNADRAPTAMDEIPATDRAPERQATDSIGAAPETAAPVEACPAVVVPSFMKAPPAAASASLAVAAIAPTPPTSLPTSAVVSASPAAGTSRAPRQPLSTETAAVDFSELLKAAVPFDPSVPSKMAVATVPPAIEAGPPRAPKHESTETVEFDLSALLNGRAPVPFDKPGTRPSTAAPEVASPRRRLIRFDPQTGAPLAVPYWQELPAGEDKK